MASATPSTLERLRDRELIWELISMETEVIQAVAAVQDRMMELSGVSGLVCDRLDAAAEEAYCENSPEAVAWKKERADAV